MNQAKIDALVEALRAEGVSVSINTPAKPHLPTKILEGLPTKTVLKADYAQLYAMLEEDKIVALRGTLDRSARILMIKWLKENHANVRLSAKAVEFSGERFTAITLRESK